MVEAEVSRASDRQQRMISWSSDKRAISPAEHSQRCQLRFACLLQPSDRPRPGSRSCSHQTPSGVDVRLTYIGPSGNASGRSRLLSRPSLYPLRSLRSAHLATGRSQQPVEPCLGRFARCAPTRAGAGRMFERGRRRTPRRREPICVLCSSFGVGRPIASASSRDVHTWVYTDLTPIRQSRFSPAASASSTRLVSTGCRVSTVFPCGTVDVSRLSSSYMTLHSNDHANPRSSTESHPHPRDKEPCNP